jgi:hypothetical protein
MQFRLAPSVGLLLLLLLLTACFGGGGDAAPETAVTDPALIPLTGNLVCGPDCLNQGQCGTTADGRTVILAHNTQPATRDHNVILANDSAVNILGQEPRNLQDAAGNPFSLNFFLVQSPAGGPASWVAGSCVNQTTQQ